MNEKLKATLAGVVGLMVPSIIINHATYHTNPGAVLTGIVVASLVGYGYGAYSVANDLVKKEYDAWYNDGYAEGYQHGSIDAEAGVTDEQ